MSRLVHTHSHSVRSVQGTEYSVQVHGEQRTDGTWAGWLEFHPLDGRGPTLRTGQETSQPDWKALDYWAGGLEPVFLDGALGRARPR